MREYLPGIMALLVGLGVMALLLYLGATSQGWVSLACWVGLAVVFHTWHAVLLRLARRKMGCDPDDDDQPFFPG